MYYKIILLIPQSLLVNDVSTGCYRGYIETQTGEATVCGGRTYTLDASLRHQKHHSPFEATPPFLNPHFRLVCFLNLHFSSSKPYQLDSRDLPSPPLSFQTKGPMFPLFSDQMLSISPFFIHFSFLFSTVLKMCSP